MLFNIESDYGDRVIGYVVPDGYSAVPQLHVRGHGQHLLTFPANETREALVSAGRHETGQCGFAIDAGLIPQIESIEDLEIFDAETGVLIYRRRPPAAIARKMLRLETHIFPLWSLDNTLGPRFQYFAKGIENYGRETVTQLFLLNHVDSVYVSGKILYRNFAYFIESGFETIIVVQDPFDELAERLLVLSKIRKVSTELLGARESAAFAPAIEFAEQLPFEDPRPMRRALRQMPEAVVALLANPLVRQLTTNTPDEMPGGGAVAAALDILAHCRLVGQRRESEAFVEDIEELLMLEPGTAPKLPTLQPAKALAQWLRESGDVDFLLEKDRELFHYIDAAMRKAHSALSLKRSQG